MWSFKIDFFSLLPSCHIHQLYINLSIISQNGGISNSQISFIFSSYINTENKVLIIYRTYLELPRMSFATGCADFV